MVCTPSTHSRQGELKVEGLSSIAATCNVVEVGVGGAKSFFEAKAAELAKGSKFQEEIKAEQEAKRRASEEAAARKEAFKAKMGAFKNE